MASEDDDKGGEGFGQGPDTETDDKSMETPFPVAVDHVVSSVSFGKSTSLRKHEVPKPHNRGRGVFCDVEEMKAKVRQNLMKEPYNVHNFYHKEGIWQAIAKHPVFENMTLAVISINALWLSLDCDYNPAPSVDKAQPLFQFVEHFFCVYFSFEWFCRYKAFRRKLDGLRDKWFVFDSALVFMMVAETWVMTLVMLAQGGGSMNAGGVASLLRLLRLLRLSRLARMLRSMPELMILIKGMVAATRSVGFTMLLLVIFMYIFAIIFTQLCENTVAGDMYFNTIPDSMFTLLVTGTFLDNLSVVLADIGRDSFVFAAMFCMFILLGALTVLNMLIGVLCEVVGAVAEKEKEEMLMEFVKTKMDEIMMELDENGDGTISKQEFEKIMENEAAVRTLNEVGVDPIGLVEYQDFIFEDEGEEVYLKFNDFMEIVLSFRGENTATVKDLVDMRKFIQTKFSLLEDKLAGRPRRHSVNSKAIRRAASKDEPDTDHTVPLATFPLLGTAASPCDAVPIARTFSAVEATQFNFPSRVAEHLQRFDAFLTTVHGELQRFQEKLPVVLTNFQERHSALKRPDGSTSHLPPLPGTPDGLASPAGRSSLSAGEFGGHLSRLEEFTNAGLRELKAIRMVLPADAPLGQDQKLHELTVWMAHIDVLLVTDWLDLLNSLRQVKAAATASNEIRIDGELRRVAACLGESLTAKLGDLHRIRQSLPA